MANNLNIQQGLYNQNTAFLEVWSEMLMTQSAGPYEMWTQAIDGNGEARISLAFLANHPVMRKWLGSRQHKSLRAYTQTIEYDDYESSLTLDTGVVDFDKTGAVGKAINEYMKQIDAYDLAVATSFDSASGAGPTGFDGVALFATTHPHANGGGTQANLAATTILNHTNLVAAEYAGMLFTHENGRPAGVQYSMMRGGPKLKRRMQELVSADRVVGWSSASLEGGTTVASATRTSVWQGDMKVAVDPRVTGFDWTLIDESKSAKPMVLFKVEAPTPVLLTDPTSQNVFSNREYTYGVNARFGVAAGHWHSAYRCTAAS